MMVWSMLLLPVRVPTLPLPLLSDMDLFLFVDPDPTHLQFFYSSTGTGNFFQTVLYLAKLEK